MVILVFYTFVDEYTKLIELENLHLTSEIGSSMIRFDCVMKAGFSFMAKRNTAKIINPLREIFGLASKRNKLHE